MVAALQKFTAMLGVGYVKRAPRELHMAHFSEIYTVLRVSGVASAKQSRIDLGQQHRAYLIAHCGRINLKLLPIMACLKIIVYFSIKSDTNRNE